MSDIKLNDEQIAELAELFTKGWRYIFKNKDGSIKVTYERPSKEYEEWDTYEEEETCVKKYDFLSWEDEEPFYFFDLFEVVYKGNK